MNLKTIALLSLLGIASIGCGPLTSPELQQERERLIAASDALREKHNPENVKAAVKSLLIGKWRYVGLTVEDGSIQLQQTNTGSPATDETTDVPKTPKEAEGTTEPESTAPRLPPIAVTDEEANQQLLEAKAALVASTRKNLVIQFTEDRSSYYYTGSNRGTNVTGQCSITTKRYGDTPFPFITFNRRTGPKMLEFLFGAEPIKQMVAKKRRADAERIRRMGAQGGRKAAAKTTYTIASIAGITVTADTLHLVLYGDMELTPRGWMRTGGLRCTFKRIDDD